MRLAPFFRLVEEVGEAPLHAHALAERLGPELARALIGAGFLVRSAPLRHYHCGGASKDGCARRVSVLRARDPLPLVARCGHRPAACAELRLSEHDVAAFAVSLAAIEAALATLYRLRGRSDPAAAPVRRLGDEPRQRKTLREVFIAWRPTEDALEQIVAPRAKQYPRTLVLVPTATDLPRAFFDRYPPDRYLEIGVLADMVVLDGATLAQRPPTDARAHKIGNARQLPALADWQDLALAPLGGRAMWASIGGTAFTLDARDLGLENERTHKPTVLFHELVEICESGGWYSSRESREAVKTRLSRIRERLMTAFGRSDDPFRDYARVMGWKARFTATPKPPSGKKR